MHMPIRWNIGIRENHRSHVANHATRRSLRDSDKTRKTSRCHAYAFPSFSHIFTCLHESALRTRLK